jgi:antitoxin component YwqK of YwqJK toxin-antitoxin module
MKSLLLILFSCFTLFVFSQEENQTDVNGKKQGLWKKYHPNGMLRYSGNFKDDKPIGVFKYYYESGNFQIKITHSGSEAYSIAYYETGELKAAGKYENQEKDSIWTYYDKEGYKIADEYYIGGKREGKWKVYFKTGKIAEEKEYSNGFENGACNQYLINGKVKLTATYVNGELQGRATYYGNNGLKAVSGKFVRGAREGFWTFYEKDGKTVRKKEEYKNGKRIDANKDDDIIDPREIEYTPEDVLSPENFMSPR